jgi:uncharacterized protein (DUF2141 family)
MIMRAMFVAILAVLTSAAPRESNHLITVRVTGFRGTKGALVCRLFRSREGFPAKPAEGMQKSAPIRVDATTETPTGSCNFADLPDGTYAVTVFHDENGNGKLDTNFIGIPSEGVGVSNNHRRLGRPTWEDARFVVNKDVSIEIALRYH